MLKIIYQNNIPILPLSIHSFEVLPKKPNILTKTPLKATIHPLIYPKDFSQFDDFLKNCYHTISQEF